MSSSWMNDEWSIVNVQGRENNYAFVVFPRSSTATAIDHIDYADFVPSFTQEEGAGGEGTKHVSIPVEQV